VSDGTAAFRCAAAARTRFDPLVGSAPQARGWLLLEHPGPWPIDAVPGSGIDPGMLSALTGRAVESATRILQPSAGFTYSYDTTKALGDRVSNMALNGTPIDPAASYRVTVNNFLADGGDGFTALKAGTDRVTQTGFDVDALAQYIGAHSPVAPGPADRITKIG